MSLLDWKIARNQKGDPSDPMNNITRNEKASGIKHLKHDMTRRKKASDLGYPTEHVTGIERVYHPLSATNDSEACRSPSFSYVFD